MGKSRVKPPLAGSELIIVTQIVAHRYKINHLIAYSYLQYFVFPLEVNDLLLYF